jgi:rubrerythrin
MKQTIENLTKAFIGESMARNRYTFYASTARKEGYEQISDIFLMTADNESEHAEWFFKMLQQLKPQGKFEDLKQSADVPTAWGTTKDNLRAALAGETHEFTDLYPEFARVAAEEGYPEFAARINAITQAEKHHGQRYGKLLKEVEAGTVFRKAEPVWWYCKKCGYMHFGIAPPEKCPSCDHERSYYQVLNEVF